MHECGQCVEDAFGGAGGDGDFGRWIVAASVQPLDLHRQRLPQGEHARHRRVLVVPFAHVTRNRVDQFRGAAVIRKSLTEVDGTVLVGEACNDGEDAHFTRWQLRPHVHACTLRTLRTLPTYSIHRSGLNDTSGYLRRSSTTRS